MNLEKDDFANDKEIQRYRQDQKEYAKMIDESVHIICEGLSLEPASHKNMKDFLMFKSLGKPILTDSFKSIADDLIQASLVEYHSSYRTAKAIYAGTDIYFFGMLTLKKSYPRTYIFRETIREKITDVFLKQDVDFTDQKKFSAKFHVITHDKNKLLLLLSKKTLNEFAVFPEMEVEFNKNRCLFRVSRRAVSIKEANRFVNLAKKIRTVLD